MDTTVSHVDGFMNLNGTPFYLPSKTTNGSMLKCASFPENAKDISFQILELIFLLSNRTIIPNHFLYLDCYISQNTMVSYGLELLLMEIILKLPWWAEKGREINASSGTQIKNGYPASLLMFSIKGSSSPVQVLDSIVKLFIIDSPHP